MPSTSPTSVPTKSPTDAPTVQPTKAPTKSPTVAPTKAPTGKPSKAPTPVPTTVDVGALGGAAGNDGDDANESESTASGGEEEESTGTSSTTEGEEDTGTSTTPEGEGGATTDDNESTGTATTPEGGDSSTTTDDNESTSTSTTSAPLPDGEKDTDLSTNSPSEGDFGTEVSTGTDFESTETDDVTGEPSSESSATDAPSLSVDIEDDNSTAGNEDSIMGVGAATSSPSSILILDAGTKPPVQAPSVVAGDSTEAPTFNEATSDREENDAGELSTPGVDVTTGQDAHNTTTDGEDNSTGDEDENGSDTSGNSSNQTSANCGSSAALRREQLFQKFSEFSGGETLDDPSSPVYKSAEWLVTTDPMQICADDENLTQRYVLVLLYFSTSGDFWASCAQNSSNTSCPQGVNRFLSDTSECEWHGITCDAGSVTHINLGKFSLTLFGFRTLLSPL